MQTYLAYQDFIGLQLPAIKIRYYDRTDARSEGDANVKYNNSADIVLTINRLSPLIYKYGFRDILFHEFTHIYDYLTFNGTKQMSPATFTAFTEIHAAYVKLMSAFGFKSYGDEMLLNCDSEFKIFQGSRTLSKFVLAYYEELLDYITEYYEKKTTDKFTKMFNHLLYCIGYLQFCERYCGIDALTVRCFMKLEKLLGSDVLQLHDIICYPYDYKNTDFATVSDVVNEFLLKSI